MNDEEMDPRNRPDAAVLAIFDALDAEQAKREADPVYKLERQLAAKELELLKAENKIAELTRENSRLVSKVELLERDNALVRATGKRQAVQEARVRFVLEAEIDRLKGKIRRRSKPQRTKKTTTKAPPTRLTMPTHLL